ncbi:hypothetical protein L1987_71714 [Smallanthus sonchifolius]|uniref:Uncharacterized protein n=1 Tax=Smallanthus sonchifolius TaxID=185202 RepID=A0ACB9ATG8_9ASTR|nr:hypothetical protein L1987_71714 [Smallanthus sonchifolius]
MRRHLTLISACRKQKSLDVVNDDDGDQVIKKIKGINQDYDPSCRKQSMQENGGGVMMIKKSQQEMGVDQDCRANVYVLRENPKRSWRVSNSSKDYGEFCKKRCDSRKGSMKDCVCEKCGKGFNSLKALYGHMRCHSIRRSQQFDEVSLVSSSGGCYDDGDDDDEVATPVRKKRSCTRYKSPKPSQDCTGLSFCDDEVEKGAICLMMLSRGVRNLDEVKLVISNPAEFAFSKLGLKKDLIFASGSGQLSPVRAGLSPVKYKLAKKPGSCDQNFGDMDATDSDISLELKRRSKGHNCPICLKEFGSGQALGCHKRVHSNNPDVHSHVSPDLDFLREVSTMVTWGSN